MPEIEQVLPPYLQIAGDLRDKIVRGDLSPGAEVPSERELAAAWSVARPTAGKALAVLRRQGLVESRRGLGTFVRPPHAAPRARERLERAAVLGTMYSDAETVDFPFVGIVEAPEYVAEVLHVSAGDRVIQRQRIIRSADSGVIELSTSWLAASLAEAAPKLLVPERIRGGTLSYLATVAGLRASYARDQVSARLASDSERAALDLPNPAAALVYWLLAYDASDALIQFDEAIYPPQRWSFRQEYPIDL